MLRVACTGWSAAFTEAVDGDLRVSSRAPGEPASAVHARVLELLGVDGAAVPRQVHGTQVVVLEQPLRGYTVAVGEADGVASSFERVAAGVHIADCLPIALGGAGGVAMLHGGWRGLAAGIAAQGVRALRSLGVEGELEAVIGPGAGGCCYETGEEVRVLFAADGASRGRLLDLKAVAAAQLREAGVSSVRDLGLCTICAPRGRFFSHRRDGAATGRMGAFAWLT
ncbi:MAG: polyphenol oxidase family protein [Solirubrobacteraceae bacterium]|jgi:YfiH family protein